MISFFLESKWIANLPGISAFIGAILLSIGNYRKNRADASKVTADATVAGAQAGAITAKSEMEIWEQGTKALIEALEKRAAQSEEREAKRSEELEIMKQKLDDCMRLTMGK